MSLECVRVSPTMALRMLQHVHRRPGQPARRKAVVELARQMLAADDRRETWQQTDLRRVVLSKERPGCPAGVILGVEVLLAVVYSAASRTLLIDRDTPLKAYLDEVDVETAPAMGEGDTQMISVMTVDTWASDPGPESTTTTTTTL